MRWMILAGLALAGSVMTQDFRCQDERGEYWSTQPCPPGESWQSPRKPEPPARRAPLEITSAMKTAAVQACEPAVQRLSATDYRWTARTPFGRWYLANVQDVGDGTIMLGGDRVEIQNQFGNWVRHKYVCIYNPQEEQVVSVGAEPGRF